MFLVLFIEKNYIESCMMYFCVKVFAAETFDFGLFADMIADLEPYVGKMCSFVGQHCII